MANASDINYHKANTDLADLVEMFQTDIASQTIIYQAYHNGDGSTNDRGGIEYHDDGWSGKQIAENKQEWNTQAISVTQSTFTSSGKYKKNNATGYTFIPTKTTHTFAGDTANPILNKYYVNGTSVDAAPIDCRPIGLKLQEITSPGTYYISRKDGVTYFSTSSTIGSGSPIHATYNPKYLVIELQSAGGGGGGSKLLGGAGGGCGGAYFAVGLYVDESAPIQIVVSSGGAGGGTRDSGDNGGTSSLTATINGTRFTLSANGGYGGYEGKTDRSDQRRSYSNTPVNVSSAPATSDKFILLASHNGTPGWGKDDNFINPETGAAGLGVGLTFNYPKSETQTIYRGPFRNGYTGDWNADIGPVTTSKGCGGGGGASYWHDGAYPTVGTAGAAGTWGSGGSGAGYHSGNQHTGGKGGDGYCVIYY